MVTSEVGVDALKLNLTIYDDNNVMEDMDGKVVETCLLSDICIEDHVMMYKTFVNRDGGSENVWYHSLSVSQRKTLMRPPFTKCTMSLTRCCHRKWCHETTFHEMCNVSYKLLFTGEMWWDLTFHKMFNATHKLLVIEKDVIYIAFHRMFDPTHFLLVIRKEMRLPFTNCAMSLTTCWS